MIEALRRMAREDLFELGLLSFRKGASIPRRTEFDVFGGTTGVCSIGGEIR